ncbi:carbohydrate kinase family protein [Allostreptomyces psammosilenae]|uniref:Fructokinase n=1 Tax=Allostreptomyces psammosilenae TaxID=1892865 RepID=A0A852ZRM1_9ACTN|nr:carbohydrate kinase [Allostreptomyces psammosilenae]NYI05096.1 fructokinase [Allostreptomyces psammosilenae]
MSERYVVVGEALVDLVGQPDGRTFVAHPGGSPANVAFGLARLGRSATLVTQLGPDPLGELVREHLLGAGVELDPAADGAERRTSTALVALDAKGAASYDFHIDWELPGLPELAADAVVLHTGSIAAAMLPGADTVEELFRRERERGAVTLSFDPNCRPALMEPHERAVARVERLVALSDVVKVSDEDLGWLYPGEPVERVAARWQASGPALVAVTRGGEGVHAVAASGAVDRPAVPVRVVDTVGAGDSFMSGLLDALGSHGLLGGERREALRAITGEELTAVVGHAALAAAITCSRSGAMPPTSDELAEAAGAGGVQATGAEAANA